jgi:hypothetical protein
MESGLLIMDCLQLKLRCRLDMPDSTIYVYTREACSVLGIQLGCHLIFLSSEQ